MDVANGSAVVDARLSGVISNITLNGNNANNPILNTMGGLNKNGLGTLELTANNTYNGPTSVNAGTLLINNAQVAGVGSGTGTSTLAVNNGGTLGGIGFIAGATTVAAGGTITGANVGSVGALTLANTLTINGTYLADVLSGTGSDLLKLTGTGAAGVLTLGAGSTLTVTGTVDGTSPYVLATYASETGTFTNTTLPSGYTLQYNTFELDLVPTAVPEPATCLGGGLEPAQALRRAAVGLIPPGRCLENAGAHCSGVFAFGDAG